MTSGSTRPHLFTIDASRPFLVALVDALVTGQIIPGFVPERDPLLLASATILLPTRRAARALRDVFLARLGGRATILPRIRPIGDVDEDFIDWPASGSDSLDAPLSGTERLLAMTKLVLDWPKSAAARLINPTTGRPPSLPASPADAVHLASSLLDLLDQMASEGADWHAITRLVPDDHAAHWELTLAFLKIVSEGWPAYLKASGREDPASRRDRLVRAEAERLMRDPPAGPVIAAGSTGSIPSTADLLAAICRLPKGAVVLPGLDRHLDDDDWRAIGTNDDPAHPPVPGHPQFGLKLLLHRLRADRSEVVVLDAEPDRAQRDRLIAISEAMRPPETTDKWRALAGRDVRRVDEAFAGVAIIHARNEAEEALAIATALRETLETEGKSAALVTPDRALARRVAADLARWGLVVDDSAGVGFSRTPPAIFARLVADVALGGYDPVALVSLLQHPLAAFGLARPEARRRARILEIGALRGPAPRAGSDGLLAALIAAEDETLEEDARPPLARRRIKPEDWENAHDLARRVAAALKPLEDLLARPGRIDLADLLAAHIAAIEAAAATPGEERAGGEAAEPIDQLFADEAGQALALKFADLVAAARDPALRVALLPRDYTGCVDAILGDGPVRRRGGLETRLHIWGPLEARLQSVDRLVLAGLNEGTWPNTTRSDPWLSRPMRADLALSPPERRIGLAAHDVAQGMAHPDVILSRSERAGTSPTVASRWLQRLTTVAGTDVARAMSLRGQRFIDWARTLDRSRSPTPKPVARPRPCPPVERRPEQLSVTAIETWIRDPYALYADRILRLEALDPIGASPDARDRGTMVHAILAQFIETWDGRDTTEARTRLRAMAEERLVDFAAFPDVVALWRPRIARIVDWFISYEAGRSAEVAKRHTEVSGRIEIPIDGGVFRLTARADRIDRMRDGTLVLLDYKTGLPPSKKQVLSLLSPQLPLEAAIALNAGFDRDLASQNLSALTYLRLSGTGDGGRETIMASDPPARPDEPTPKELAADSLARLTRLIRAYRNPSTSYPSRPRIMFEAARDGRYDHLARVKEWSTGEGGEE
jgi:ATP-dependent helicase/nuclease subunit B